MKALVHEKKTGMEGLSYREIETPTPRPNEVRVQVKVAGLNHRDLFVLHRHKPEDPPLILGSDGAGVVEVIGDEVTGVNVGDEIIINPGLGWDENSDAPPKGFEIVGLPNDGTFAEQIVIPAKNAILKPTHLTWEEAGVLSLPALTAYRALFTRGKVQPGMKVFIPGIGSGVATFLLQFATAVGAEVYVSSRSEYKRNQAMELGAKKAIDSNADWNVALDGEKMDLVIESVGAATFDKSLAQLRPGGTLVTFGASAGDEIKINLRTFFYGQYNLLGSTMGSKEEYQEMLHFLEKHNLKPVIDKTYSLKQYAEAFNRLEEAEQFGKIGFIIGE